MLTSVPQTNTTAVTTPFAPTMSMAGIANARLVPKVNPQTVAQTSTNVIRLTNAALMPIASTRLAVTRVHAKMVTPQMAWHVTMSMSARELMTVVPTQRVLTKSHLWTTLTSHAAAKLDMKQPSLTTNANVPTLTSARSDPLINASCADTDGTFTCTCIGGYEVTGQTCTECWQPYLTGSFRNGSISRK